MRRQVIAAIPWQEPQMLHSRRLALRRECPAGACSDGSRRFRRIHAATWAYGEWYFPRGAIERERHVVEPSVTNRTNLEFGEAGIVEKIPDRCGCFTGGCHCGVPCPKSHQVAQETALFGGGMCPLISLIVSGSP